MELDGKVGYTLILRNLTLPKKNVRIEFLPDTFARYRLKRIAGKKHRYSERMGVDEKKALALRRVPHLSLPHRTRWSHSSE